MTAATGFVAAHAVRDDLHAIKDKYHRALHDQILEALSCTDDRTSSSSGVQWLRIGQGGRFCAAIAGDASARALLAVGGWHDHALLIAGRDITHFKRRPARSYGRKDVRATLLMRGDQVVGVVTPAPPDAAQLEQLILTHSPKLDKLLARRLASLEREGGLAIGAVFGWL